MMWHCVSTAMEYADNNFNPVLIRFIVPTGTSMAWISKSCFDVRKIKKKAAKRAN